MTTTKANRNVIFELPVQTILIIKSVKTQYSPYGIYMYQHFHNLNKKNVGLFIKTL